jgi:hypothetical protein
MNIKSFLLKTPFILFLSTFCIFADSNKVGTYNVGAAAGWVTGYGLSYRQWFNKNGIQLTMAPYYNNNANETNYSMSLGVTGLHIIKEANYVNLFLYYGPHFWYSYDRYPTYSYYPSTSSNDTIIRNKLLFLGGGPGFDFHFWRMSFNLMFGLAFRTDFKDNSGIQFTGETSLYYSF